MLLEGDERALRLHVGAHPLELVAVGLAGGVEQVVVEQHARVAAVGAREAHVGLRAGGEREVDADLKGVGHDAAGGHHLVEHGLFALGREHQDQTARLEGEAVDELAGQDHDAALAVHVDEVEPVLGDGVRAVGLVGVDLRSKRARS